jgi:hypothetical protein
MKDFFQANSARFRLTRQNSCPYPYSPNKNNTGGRMSVKIYLIKTSGYTAQEQLGNLLTEIPTSHR